MTAAVPRPDFLRSRRAVKNAIGVSHSMSAPGTIWKLMRPTEYNARDCIPARRANFTARKGFFDQFFNGKRAPTCAFLHAVHGGIGRDPGYARKQLVGRVVVWPGPKLPGGEQAPPRRAGWFGWQTAIDSPGEKTHCLKPSGFGGQAQ